MSRPKEECYDSFAVVDEGRYQGVVSIKELYGSHIFQDLVEAGILYCAVFDNEKTVAFHPELLQNMENKLTDVYPDGDNLKEIIGVYSMEDINCTIYHDMKGERMVCSCR